MKITMLSEIDYAASGHRLCEAIRRHTDHDIEIFTGRYQNKFRHPQNMIKNALKVQNRVNESDIIHLKGDFPPKNGYIGLDIMHKPIIVSTSGSHFRKKENGGHEYYKPREYNTATIKTAFTPDLCYPEYSAVWTPHTVNSHVQCIEWKCAVHPILMHTPTRPEVKGTAFIKEVFTKLSRRMKIETVVIDNIPFKKVVEMRKEATIFFDQFKVGFYGNSAIEAMQFGIPVCAWISPQAKRQANGFLYDCPVITYDKLDPDVWAKKIEKILDGNLQALSIKTKRWCNHIHSYQSVAKQWESIYNAV
jgi:glycosyltransferase involved in cell wall biosynthesis